MTMEIELKSLSLNYGAQQALKDISFKMSGEKIYGLLGRNGAGKTSLLSILASFREQTKGSIKIAGEAPFENAKIMQQVAFIYNKNYKEEKDTVKSALEGIARYRPNFDKDYANELANRFKLPFDKQIKHFSKGMQSALNVTIGLACRAPITIFDESYLGMDAPTREMFYQELLKDQEKHPRMMIVSTHLVSEMDYLFDEILILDKGKLLLQEEYDTLVSKGVSVTGRAEDVDDFVESMRQLNVRPLGGMKSVMVYGEMSEDEQNIANQKGLEIGTISLQDLFIYLTEEGADSHEKTYLS